MSNRLLRKQQQQQTRRHQHTFFERHPFVSIGIKIFFVTLLIRRLTVSGPFFDDYTGAFDSTRETSTTKPTTTKITPEGTNNINAGPGTTTTTVTYTTPATHQDKEKDDEDFKKNVYLLGGKERTKYEIMDELKVGKGDWGPSTTFQLYFQTEEDSERYYKVMKKIMDSFKAIKKRYGQFDETNALFKKELQTQYMPLVGGAIGTFGADMIPFNIQHMYNHVQEILGMPLQQWPPRIPSDKPVASASEDD
jgi:hypothetical protein